MAPIDSSWTNTSYDRAVPCKSRKKWGNTEDVKEVGSEGTKKKPKYEKTKSKEKERKKGKKNREQ